MFIFLWSRTAHYTAVVVADVVVVVVVDRSYVDHAAVLSHVVPRHHVDTQIHIVAHSGHEQRVSSAFALHLVPAENQSDFSICLFPTFQPTFHGRTFKQ